MSKVWVITYSSGQYSDWSMQVIGAFTGTESEVQALTERLAKEDKETYESDDHFGMTYEYDMPQFDAIPIEVMPANLVKSLKDIN